MILKIALYGPAGCGKDYVARKLREAWITYKMKHKDMKLGEFKRFAFADVLKENLGRFIGMNDEELEKFKQDEKYKNDMLVNLRTFKMIHMPGWNNGINDIYHEYKTDIEPIIGTNNKIMTATEVEDDIKYGFPTNSLTEAMNYAGCDYYMTLREMCVYYGSTVMCRWFGNDIWADTIFNSKEYQESIDNNDLIVFTDMRFNAEYQQLLKQGYKIIKIVLPEFKDNIKNASESHYDKFKPDYIFENSYDDEELMKHEEEFLKYLLD
jgi:hypothetical protein